MSIHLIGFSEQPANKVGQKAIAAVVAFSRHLPLGNLDGITIAADYLTALSSVDRGAAVRIGSPIPTSDEGFGVGVAMALPVDRDGVTKTHIVFGPEIFALLERDDDETALSLALVLIAHELGHAADHENQYQAFGNFMFRPTSELIPDPMQHFLWEFSRLVWAEYYANRVAVALTGHGHNEIELFTSARANYCSRINEARARYHRHVISLDQFLRQLTVNLNPLLISTGYLLGLLDASSGDPAADDAAELFAEPESEPLAAFHDALIVLWNSCGSWKSHDELLCLNEPVRLLLASLELYPSVTEDGQLYLRVPLLP